MNSIEKDAWERVRVKGKINYILFRGGIAWGLPVGIAWNIIRYFFSNDYYEDPTDFFYRGAFMIIGFFLGGCLFALWEWNKQETQYLTADKADSKNT